MFLGLPTVSQRRTTPRARFNARESRHNLTPAEVKLWGVLRSEQINNIRFRRQHPVGGFVVDFCAPGQKLVIELDGGQHLEDEGYDVWRTRQLEGKGYRVLRFWNNDVENNLDGVIIRILEVLENEEE